jgi:hypothetical protein
VPLVAAESARATVAGDQELADERDGGGDPVGKVECVMQLVQDLQNDGRSGIPALEGWLGADMEFVMMTTGAHPEER